MTLKKPETYNLKIDYNIDNKFRDEKPFCSVNLFNHNTTN